MFIDAGAYVYTNTVGWKPLRSTEYGYSGYVCCYCGAPGTSGDMYRSDEPAGESRTAHLACIRQANDDPNVLGPADLVAWRKRLELTQAQLAAALGTSTNNVARWERGEVAMTLPAAIRAVLERLGAQREPDA